MPVTAEIDQSGRRHEGRIRRRRERRVTAFGSSDHLFLVHRSRRILKRNFAAENVLAFHTQKGSKNVQTEKQGKVVGEIRKVKRQNILATAPTDRGEDTEHAKVNLRGSKVEWHANATGEAPGGQVSHTFHSINFFPVIIHIFYNKMFASFFFHFQI